MDSFDYLVPGAAGAQFRPTLGYLLVGALNLGLRVQRVLLTSLNLQLLGDLQEPLATQTISVQATHLPVTAYARLLCFVNEVKFQAAELKAPLVLKPSCSASVTNPTQEISLTLTARAPPGLVLEQLRATILYLSDGALAREFALFDPYLDDHTRPSPAELLANPVYAPVQLAGALAPAATVRIPKTQSYQPDSLFVTETEAQPGATEIGAVHYEGHPSQPKNVQLYLLQERYACTQPACPICPFPKETCPSGNTLSLNFCYTECPKG